MKIIAVVKCDSCCTLEEIKLKEGVNMVRGCKCGSYYGIGDKKITIQIENR